MDPYEKLANAIIIQAVKDYRKALREGKSGRIYEQFFHSEWFGILTSLDGETLIERIRRKMNCRQRNI